MTVPGSSEERQEILDMDRANGPVFFEGVLAVSEYLTGLGYRAGKSTVYMLVKEGKLKAVEAGKFLREDVEACIEYLSLRPGLVAGLV